MQPSDPWFLSARFYLPYSDWIATIHAMSSKRASFPIGTNRGS